MKRFILILFSLSILIGCAPEIQKIPDGISLDIKEISVDSYENRVNVTVTRNTKESTYKISVPSWIAEGKTVTEGLKDIIQFTVSENTSPYMRSGEISIGDKTVTVIQDGRASMIIPPSASGIESITPSSLAFDEKGGMKTIEVTIKNVEDRDYPVSCSDDWINVTKSTEDGQKDIWNVTADENTSVETRTGIITFDGIPVHVMQEGRYEETVRKIVIDEITPSLMNGIAYKDMNYQVKAHVEPMSEPQELEFRLTSRGTRDKSHGTDDWKIPDDIIDSYTVLDQDGIFSVPYDFWMPNTDNGKWSRNFRLTVSSRAYPEISTYIDFTVDRDLSASITGTAPSAITLTDSLSAHRTVEVETSTEGSTVVSVVSQPTWLRINETGISGRTRSFDIEIAPHRGSVERTGEIVFQDQNGGRRSITITQPAGNSSGENYVWLSGIHVDESKIRHIENRPGSRYVELYEEAGVYDGWYNVTKSELSDQPDPADDENLCWAMSASGAIHWWADNNRKYIDAFSNLHPEVLEPQNIGGNLVIPAMDFTYDNTVQRIRDKSSIAPIYIRNHFDEGDMPYQALIDMLFVPRIPHDQQHRADAVYPGWFEEVFRGRETEVVKEHQILSMSDLHFLMEDAIENNTALILTYHLRFKDGHHAVNIWGVRYDEEGNITQLMISDNNLNGTHRDHPAEAFMHNILVRESSLGYAEIGNSDYPDSDRWMGQITNITSLSLGTDIWEEWADKNGITV